MNSINFRLVTRAVVGSRRWSLWCHPSKPACWIV